MNTTSKPNLINIKWDKLIIYFLLLLGVYVMVAPFLWMIFTAFKTFPESQRLPIQLLPDSLYLENFRRILQMNLGTFYSNTIIVTFFITGAQIITASMAGYAFARIEFPGRDYLFLVFLALIMIPAQMTLIPRFAIAVNLGLFNTLTGIIFPNVISVTMTFFMRQSFLSFPKELEEAARIDGCSHFRIFWRILMPLSTPTLVAMGVLVALFAWNDLLWPLVVTSSDRVRVLSVFISSLRGEHEERLPYMMAAGTLSVMPMLMVFILGQKYFIMGITMTGLKD